MITKVAVYIRKHGSRAYEKASPRKDYPTGTIFCLRYTLDGVRKYETLNVPNWTQANIAAGKKSVELQIQAAHKQFGKRPAPVPKPVPAPPVRHALPTGDLVLDVAIDRYIENVQTKSSKTSGGYRYTLQQFYASSGNSPLSHVTTQHLYNFVGYLRREGLGDRTVHNRVGEVVTFMRHFGIKEVTMRVKYVEQKVRAYRPDELKALFQAADPEEWILFQFFNCTGA
jgi:hypothetical protein